MLKIKTDRTYKIPYEQDGDSFSITFKFTPSEDLDLTQIRQKLVKAAIDADLSAQMDTVDHVIRRSIIDCEDIFDEDTNEPVKLKNEDGSINEYVQKVLMDVIKMYPDYYLKVLTAYMGPKGKNLKTGVTEQLTGAGGQENVEHASLTSAE